MAMITEIKKSVVRGLLPKRRLDSHKGQNGRVMIVGGSEAYYGAPILSGMAALRSGADLVYLYVPECNYEVTRAAAPDFIVRKFEGKYLKESDAGAIIELGKKMDSVLIGPGLGEHEESISTVVRILNELHIPTVLDASGMLALKEIKKFPLQQPVVVTPHNNEFQHLVDRDVLVKEDDPKSVILLRSLSMDLHINVLLKSAVDFVSSDEGLVEKNLTGNAGMTVGGSGDVLAGVVASFMAQGLEGFDAARCAAFVVGRAGDLLFKEKGVCYTASEIAEMVGVAVNKL